MSVTVRYWAAAKAAAGVPEEAFDAAGTLASLLDAVRAAHDDELATVLGRCSYLVDEVSPGRASHADVVVADGAVVDVLPPFAGGSGPGEEQSTPAPTLRRS